jgi:hypothetical protein
MGCVRYPRSGHLGWECSSHPHLPVELSHICNSDIRGMWPGFGKLPPVTESCRIVFYFVENRPLAARTPASGEVRPERHYLRERRRQPLTAGAGVARPVFWITANDGAFA